VVSINLSWAQVILETNSVSNSIFGEVEVNNVPELNSQELDFSPIYFDDGLLITSTRVSAAERGGWFQRPYTDLFYAAKSPDGTYDTPVTLPPEINTKFHDGVAATNADGSVLYFSRNDKRPTGFAKKKVRLKIYWAERRVGNWSVATEWPFNLEKYSTCHPSLNESGTVMYFASDRPGGFGGMDLYVSRFLEGQWQAPQNLGAAVNSSGHELFPFIANDGQLYFTSDGHEGMGKLDLFIATPKRGTWQVQNLGKPFNSRKDDFGFVMHADGTEGFFASDRDGGMGKDDIYAWSLIQLEPPLTKVTAPAFKNMQADKIVYGKKLIKVVDAQTNRPLEQVKVVISEANKPGKVIRYYTDANGLFDFNWDSTSKYFFSTARNGYAGFSKILTPSDMLGDQELLIRLDRNASDEVVLKPDPQSSEVFKFAPQTEVKDNALTQEIDEYFMNQNKETFSEGQLVQLDNIYYAFNEYLLEAAAKKELLKVVQLLSDYPKMEIELNAHTDAVGSATYNQWLSEQRAEAVVSFIVDSGIAAHRISAKGYGESQLLNHCGAEVNCSSAEQALNRRTEFLIKKVGPKIVSSPSVGEQWSRPSTVQAVQAKSTGNAMMMLMKPIYYDFGREQLWSTAKEELDKVAGLLKRHPGMKIRVLSYTDVIGTKSYNLKLSHRRARIAAEYLRQHGIGASRVDFKGMGESHINNHCGEGVACSAAERRMNRRTEIQILDPGGAELAIQNEK
ncbi:MAG: OmpA family protein, partial [Bacteroidota bacterium]